MNVKITKQTARYLEFKARPPLWIILIIWAAALGMLLAVCPALVIHGDRPANGQVNFLIEHRLFRIALTTTLIPKVQGVVLDVRGRSPEFRRVAMDVEDGETSRIVLLTETGKHPVTTAYSSDLGAHGEAVATLNGFLDDPNARTTEVALHASTVAWWIEGLLLFAALGSVFAGWVKGSLDVDGNRVTIWGPGRPQFRRQIFKLSDVERFALRQRLVTDDADEANQLDSAYETGERYSLALALFLRTGKEVTLAENMAGGIEGWEFLKQLELFRKNAASIIEISHRSEEKRCAICGGDCAHGQRLQDDLGRYYHPQCYQQATEARELGNA